MGAGRRQGERAVMPTAETDGKANGPGSLPCTRAPHSFSMGTGGLALQFKARERLRLLERNGRKVKAGMHALAL